MENAERKVNEATAASTQDILGDRGSTFKVEPRWSQHFSTLTELRESVLNRRRDLVSQAAEGGDVPRRNLAELATDEYDRDLALALASSEQEILYEIDQAINRIRIGAYGTCEATGKPIDPERLKALPWTRFSAEAERELEAEGQIRAARLGDHLRRLNENRGSAA